VNCSGPWFGLNWLGLTWSGLMVWSELAWSRPTQSSLVRLHSSVVLQQTALVRWTTSAAR
jgi:hypothetical protein